MEVRTKISVKVVLTTHLLTLVREVILHSHRESKNTKLYEIGSGTKLLFTFLSLKVFRHEERETQSFYADCFCHRQLSTQPTRGARSAQRRRASSSSESQPSSSEAGTQLTAFSQISAHVTSAWRHPNTLVSIPIWDFYFDISEWHILSGRAWIPALMLHLTNPCAKRKVLSLTKPKGKICKTKSLGNYITHVLLWQQCQYKDKHKNKKILKTKIERRITVWIFQATSRRDCKRLYQDIPKRRKLTEKNWISSNSSTK